MAPKPGQHLKSIVKPSIIVETMNVGTDAGTVIVDQALAEGESVVDEIDNGGMYRTFTNQAIALIGSPTSDGRMLASDIDLSFRTFPLPFMWCEQSAGGHSNSYTVGVLESAEVSGDKVLGSGYFLNTDAADKAVYEVAHGVSNPSVDLAGADYVYTDADGKELDWDALYDLMDEGGEYFMTFKKAELIGTTLVSTPAFDTKIELDAERSSRDVAIVASVVDEVDSLFTTYDPSLFANPNLLRPTRPTMDKETGRIYGHLAEFGHSYRGGNGERVPRNVNDYANFHTSQVLLDDGKQLAVGHLTVKGGHAPTDYGVTAATARAHYDNVCSSFGLVRVGEDRHGIWFSGVPAPGVDPDVFQQGMTAPLSGDWRNCGQGLDMIAAHAVVSPGFPIYSGSTGPDGRDVALVAAFGPRPEKAKGGKGMVFTEESMKTLLISVIETLDERKAQKTRDRAEAQARDAALARAAKLADGYPGKIAGDKQKSGTIVGPGGGTGQPSGGGSYPGKIGANQTVVKQQVSVKTGITGAKELAAALARAAKAVGK